MTFYRLSDPTATKPKIVPITVTERCHRCGGQGGGPQWAFTGYTCFECRGACMMPYTHREYAFPHSFTVADCETFMAARDERLAAKRQAKADKFAAEAAAERQAVLNANPEFAAIVARSEAGEEFNYFVADVLRQFSRKVLSERQIEAVVTAVAKDDVEAAAKAASAAKAVSRDFIGHAGDKLTFTGTVTVRAVIEGHFGYRPTSSLLVIVENDEGTIKCFTTAASFNAVQKGDTVTVAGTIKDHELYEGVKQTALVRPKVLEVK